MSDRRVGPEIEGHTFLEYLGEGGYSDVYLYERRKPRMRVAVKVLTDTRLSDSELRQFAAEAEAMAELADHPYIVQVFSTGATDDGRPYLIMKYYPPPNLGVRAATERFSVAEVLRTGIQITSAVETAHRSGILHRDIKPANILISQYGEPGLADFGIAGRATETDEADDIGVSIPWSPPEVLSGASNGSVTSDVYSLAATLWHLLAGRSPFEIPRGDNSSRALVGRIHRSAPPATGRADVPPSLNRLLQQAMSKQPQQRPESALAFARALQAVEQELRYSRTEIVVGDHAIKTDDRDGTDTKAAPQAEQTVTRDTSAPRSAAPLVPPKTESTGLPSTTVRPTRPDSGPPSTAQRPARPTAPVEARPPSTFAPTPAAGPNGDRTSLRPQFPVETVAPARHRFGADAAPATTQRPISPTVTPADDVLPKRRGVKTRSAVLITAGVVIAAVAVGVVVLATGSKGRDNTGTQKPPVGNDQGGIGPQTLQPPQVVGASYRPRLKLLTFTWREPGAQAGASRFVYRVKTQSFGPTTKTSASIRTRTPGSTCITVGVVQSDGTTTFGPSRCGRT